MKYTINLERIKEEFSYLVSIDSVSFEERKMAEALKEKLVLLGFAVSEDDFGKKDGKAAGNLYGFLEGSLPGKPILLSAHLDTVTPGKGKRAIFHPDGTITSDQTTVLGGDDLTGIVGILEGIRCVKEAGLPHRSIEILFPAAEEVYCRGSRDIDYEKIQAEDGYVFDLSGRPGVAAIEAPTILSFEAVLHGKAAHAGFCPEEGVHSIAILCEALTHIRQGHLDEETTLNIGLISGGEATNIVPKQCCCRGEIRSYSHEKALESAKEAKEIFEQAAKKAGAALDFTIEEHIKAYKISAHSSVVRRFQRVCKDLGLLGELTKTFGGSDNNHFARHGINGIVLSCGMYQVHSVEEFTTLEDLALCAKLVAGLLTLEEGEA
jgi:tripeptide aminopeptidase